MKKLLLGSLLAAVALFAWGFLFWGMLPTPGRHIAPDQPALQEALSENIPETGAYYVPYPPSPDDNEAIAPLHEAGPIAFMFVSLQGEPMMAPAMMIGGFVHMFITTLLIGMLLSMLLPILPTWRNRVLFVALVGLVVAFWSDFAWPIWWRTPWTFFVWMAAYDIIAWTIAGAILARFVKPAA